MSIESLTPIGDAPNVRLPAVTVCPRTKPAQEPKALRHRVAGHDRIWVSMNRKRTNKGEDSRSRRPPAKRSGREDLPSQALRAHAGQDFHQYKPSTLMRRIYRRMGLHSLEGLAAYVEFLRTSPAEMVTLVKDLMISIPTRDKSDGPSHNIRALWARVITYGK